MVKWGIFAGIYYLKLIPVTAEFFKRELNAMKFREAISWRMIIVSVFLDKWQNQVRAVGGGDI